MRYRDASHVDTGSFFARRPCIGGWYRLFGHAGALAAALAPVECLWWTALGLIIAWLAAWYQVVGTLWRSSLVAALLIVAVRLTIAHGTGAAS